MKLKISGLKYDPESSKSYTKGTSLFQASSITDTKPQHLVQTIAGLMLTQMTARAGIRKHGDRARDAIRKEFKQMVDKNVYSAMRKRDLTPEQIQEALRAINVIKEKRCGKLKGRHCADGSP